MMGIKVRQFSDKILLDSEDGVQIWARISDYLKRGDVVTLDFQDIDMIRPNFVVALFHEAIKMYSSDYLNAHIKMVNMQWAVGSTMKSVIERMKND